MGKKIMSIVLIFSLFYSAMPTTAWAVEQSVYSEEEIVNDESESQELSQILTEEETAQEKEEILNESQQTSEESHVWNYEWWDAWRSGQTDVYGISSFSLDEPATLSEQDPNVDEIAMVLREKILNRDFESLSYTFNVYMDSDEQDSLAQYIYYKAYDIGNDNCAPAESFRYLTYYAHVSMETVSSSITFDGVTYGSTTLNITFDTDCATTKDQELYIDAQCRSIVDSLNLSNKNEYQKAKSIYDWISNNIGYTGLSFMDEKPLSLYKALTERKANDCQMAFLFQFLYYFAGGNSIPAQFVYMDEEDESIFEGHFSNIATVDGKSYYLEYPSDDLHNPYSRFLLGNDNWTYEPITDVASSDKNYLPDVTLDIYTEEKKGIKIKEFECRDGSFRFDTGKKTDVTKWETTDYDVVYMEIDAEKTQDFQSMLDIEIKAPKGFSFEEYQIKTTYELKEYGMDDEDHERIPLYPIYSEEYRNSSDTDLYFECNYNVYSYDKRQSADWKNDIKTAYVIDHVSAFQAYSNIVMPPSDYDQQIALFSAFFSQLMENSNKTELKENINNLCYLYGFSKVKYSDSRKSSIRLGNEEEYLCATKKIIVDDTVKEIVLLAIQGTDFIGVHTLADWIGNVRYNSSKDMHSNFMLCAENNGKDFSEYVKKTGANSDCYFLVTGHSRGGSIANLIASTLSSDHTHCYTFAASNVGKNVDPSLPIYNLVNYADIVPFIPAVNGYSKNGHILTFNTEDTSGDASICLIRLASKLKYLGKYLDGISNFKKGVAAMDEDLLAQHDMRYYVEAVSSNNYQDFESDFSIICEKHDIITSEVQQLWDEILAEEEKIKFRLPRIIKSSFIEGTICCPVDIEILDAANNVVCKITNDNIEFCNAEDILVLIINDKKEIIYPKTSDYHLNIIGYDDGTMDSSFICYDQDGEIEKVYHFENYSVKNNQKVLGVMNAENGLVFENNTEEVEADSVINGGEEKIVNVMIESEDESISIVGSGEYLYGESAWISAASDDENLVFDGWYDQNGKLVSEDQLYVFIVTSDCTLIPVFKEFDPDHVHSGAAFVPEVPATCTENGQKSYYTCSGCDKKFEDQELTIEIEDITITSKGHQYTDTVVSPTETEQGYTEHKCSVCGDSYRDNYTEPTGTHEHVWDDGVVTKKATCTSDGILTYTCESCNETKTEVIEATGHEYKFGRCINCGEKQYLGSNLIPSLKPWIDKLISDLKNWFGSLWR